MVERGRARRRGPAEPASSGPRRPGRRGVWTMIAFSFVIFIVIVVAETQSEMAKRAQQTTAPAAGGQTAAGNSAGTAVPEPVPLLKRLRDHYRSHELPLGWVVANIAAPRDDAGAVSIVFSPSVGDRRYGQPAPADDVDHGSFCPKPPEFWREIGGAAITVELGDKTGVIKRIACKAATDSR